MGTPDEDINRWGQSTYDRFDTLRCSAEGARAGVQFVTCHTLTSESPASPENIPAWAHIAHNFTDHSHCLTAAGEGGSELQGQREGPSGKGHQKNGVYGMKTSLLTYSDGVSLTQEFGTYIVDQTYYLPYLAAQVDELGVQQYQQTVGSFDELARSGYKCVFNCAGAHIQHCPQCCYLTVLL